VWDVTSIAAATGAISAAVGGLLTFAATKGVDAYLKYKSDRRIDKEADRKAEMEGRVYEDDQARNANKQLIDELSRRLNQVDTALSDCHHQHLESIASLGVLKGQVEILTNQNKEYRTELADLREEVHRLKRHEENNLANVAVLKQLELHQESIEALKQTALAKSPAEVPITAEAKRAGSA
jgi:hypothetical protein